MQLLTGLLTILFLIAVLLIVTGIRAIAWATPWVLIGYVGLVLGAAVGGLPAWLIAGVNGARWGGLIAGTLAWAVLGGLYGAKIGWQRWWGQHYDFGGNPFAAALGVPLEEPDQLLSQALALRKPALAAGAAAGAAFGIVGGLGAWAMHYQRGSFVIWVGAGAVALAAEGAVMGAALGAKHSRLGTVLYAEQVFNLSIGENLGRVLAGPEPGPRAATGWAIGYALDGALAGAIVGTFVGPAAVAALLKLG